VPGPCMKGGQLLRCCVAIVLRITAPSGIVETLYSNALTLLWQYLLCALSLHFTTEESHFSPRTYEYYL